MKRFLIALTVMATWVPWGGSPALEGQAPTQAPDDPIFQSLFSAELVMQHRRAIGLTDEQRDAISRMIQDLQGKVVSIQWELLDDMQDLSDTLQRPRVDLDRALDQLDVVLEQEKRVKQAHLELLIRIKNVLRPEQIQQLERLRREAGRT